MTCASTTWVHLEGGVLKQLKCVGEDHAVFFLLLLGKIDVVCLLGCGKT